MVELRISILSKSRLVNSENEKGLNFSLNVDISREIMVPVSTVKQNNNTGVLITIIICLFLSIILAVYYFFAVNKKVDSDPVLMVDHNSQVRFEKEGAPSIHSINGVFGP